MNENHQDKVANLLARSEITSVINSYFRALDEKRFDAQHFASVLTVTQK